VSLAEVRAFANLLPVMNYLRISYKFTDYPWHNASALGDCNLLTLGGPGVNKVTAEALQILQSKLPFRFDIQSLCIEVGNRQYKPVYDAGTHKVTTDYAIILRAHNPFNSSHETECIMVMGCHGFGTEGASLCLRDRKLANELTKQSKKSSFVSILEVSPHLDSYVTKVLETYVLPEA
jgi:hypothetical protein